MSEPRTVKTVQFKPQYMRHALDENDVTCCNIDVAGTIRAFRSYNGTTEERPVADVTCISCLLRGGLVSRRKGKCRVAQAPKRRVVHLLIEDGSGEFKTHCRLNFFAFPEDTREGTFADITCGHCQRYAHDMP